MRLESGDGARSGPCIQMQLGWSSAARRTGGARRTPTPSRERKRAESARRPMWGRLATCSRLITGSPIANRLRNDILPHAAPTRPARRKSQDLPAGPAADFQLPASKSVGISRAEPLVRERIPAPPRFVRLESGDGARSGPCIQMQLGWRSAGQPPPPKPVPSKLDLDVVANRNGQSHHFRGARPNLLPPIFAPRN